MWYTEWDDWSVDEPLSHFNHRSIAIEVELKLNMYVDLVQVTDPTYLRVIIVYGQIDTLSGHDASDLPTTNLVVKHFDSSKVLLGVGRIPELLLPVRYTF